MTATCPFCLPYPKRGPNIIRRGQFWRKSDGQAVQRYMCRNCKNGFSAATSGVCYRQNKRHKNEILRRLLCSGVSQRRAARILNLNRITVLRKFLFLSQQSLIHFEKINKSHKKSSVVEFDDMETFEHTKCKPLSITLAVEYPSRRILGFEVSKMPAKGRLARISVKKYGIRRDQRHLGRRALFRRIQPLIEEVGTLKSDQNPHYPADVAKFFPRCTYNTFKGQRGSTTGGGELKKVRFDPIFRLNHTCAKFRADVNRLFRKTWCTTKRPDRLTDHLNIYAHYHNQNL